MAREVELSALDLRYESYRMRNPGLEGRLLASIAQRGIEEPLEGVDANERSILLNGFKRYRCARKLGIARAPYASLGEDEALGIMNLLRASNNRSLGILEQARFTDDLRKLHKMTVAEIAQELSRSKAWVSMRLGLIGEMSERVRQEVFAPVPEVLSHVQPLPDEVLPARGADALAICRARMHHRQHESGPSAGHGQRRGDRAGDGGLCQAVRLQVPLP